MVGYYYDTRLRDNEVRIKRQTGPEELKISFRRTVRVPDNSSSSQLPPDLGSFPLHKVQDFADTLPGNVVGKGGIFMPVYQREAMWIKFKANSLFAIKVYVGSINVVSGEPALETFATKLHRQFACSQDKSVHDYVVVPRQLWLDGIASSSGAVKQFVATPLGDGYTVEAQITKEEAHGGLQFEITPAGVGPSAGANRMITVTGCPNGAIYMKIANNIPAHKIMTYIGISQGILIEEWRFLAGGCRLRPDEAVPLDEDVIECLKEQWGGGPERSSPKVEMGIAAGGKIKQAIVCDHWPTNIWHKKATIAFNVHLLNAQVFETVTGMAAPETPVTMKVYEESGLPFYELYEEPSNIHGAFKNVKSIGEIDGVEDRNYATPTKIINPEAAHKENAKTTRSPEDISNPAGPLREFRSVSEIEQEVRDMTMESSA